MNIHAYVINLRHATRRWERVKANLIEREIPYTRIDGVYGKELSDPIEQYDERRYRITHGKTTNRGEIGCYLSHIRALETFLKSADPYGLILEDDICLPKNIKFLLNRAECFADDWDLLRLTAFTPGKHLALGKLDDKFSLSYNVRVLKNTGAYWINRHAAACILNKMLPMYLPYDVALDREWHYGFKTACIIPFPIQLNDEPSQIPAARKIRFYRTTTFKFYHYQRFVERHIYRRRFYRKATENA